MISFLVPALFAGFLAVIIPPIVHLFNRRKYDQVDWAAMQFLEVSPKTRRKVVFEQLWLMLLRMAILAFIVLALASPTLTSSLLNWLGATGSGARDIVILIDGSASMAYKQDGEAGATAARVWVARFLDTLRPGDRVALFQARQQAIPLLGTLSEEFEQARNSLDLMNSPRGGIDWPACVQTAWGLLDQVPIERTEREIVIVTDGQRYSWADENTLAKWELIPKGNKAIDPRLWVVNIAENRPVDPHNSSLDPIYAGRGVASAGREVKFRSAVRYSGTLKTGSLPVPKVKLEIDGRAVSVVPVTGSIADGVIPLQFVHKFTAGSHLVSLQMEPDELPGDNRQDFAIEVLSAVPVLIIDGETQSNTRTLGGEFLRDALAPAKDLSPGFFVRLIRINEFNANALSADVKGPGTPPRVVVFSDVAKLSKEQNDAIEKYLVDGGAVLFSCGERSDKETLNRISFRGGQGWLPGRLIDTVGNEDDIEKAPKPLPASFSHPAMELFKEQLPGGLHSAYFPRRWKIDANAGVNGSTGIPIASLSNGDTLLIERGVGRGRAMLCSVPLDNGWTTNLHTLPDFVRFTHELMYYLAAAKSAERNLSVGQPIVYSPRADEPLTSMTLHPPEGASRVVQVKQWPLVLDVTREPGVYRLTNPAGRNFYYAVRSDPNESVLTPCGEEDRKRVADAVKRLTYISEPADLDAKRGEGPQTRELWWLILLMVLGLLASEVWYTRRLSERGMPLEDA